MNLLGIDTSTAASAACVLRADGEAFEVVPDAAALHARPRHAQELMPAVHEALERSGLGFHELDAVAVGVGPGTFTGLRIGVATARALASARGLELRPVGSLAALAGGIEAPLRLAVIDAKRGEVFASLHDGNCERWPPAALAPATLAERLQADGLRATAAGDGALQFREVLEAAGARVEPDGSPAHVVRGLHVCRLALQTPARLPEAVVPEYLRLPDATPR